MIFPIGDENIRKGAKPVVTYLLLMANIVVFLYQFLMNPYMQQKFVFEYGSIPIETIHGQDLYTLFTCMFLHGGWMHLIGNMMFLWVFADNIEATIGNFKFLLFYIGGGLVAAITHTLLNPNSQIPCVGASGAIAACLGAYLVMYPTSKIKMLFFFLFTFHIPALLFLGVWIVQQFFNGMGTIAASTDNVAYWAHIGGFIFGMLCGAKFRAKAKQMEIGYWK